MLEDFGKVRSAKAQGQDGEYSEGAWVGELAMGHV